MTGSSPRDGRLQAPGGTRRRVLLVEDDQDSRDLLRLLLERAGHEVREAGDGPAGIEATLAHRPDAALVDIGLPGLDGYEVARQIRAAPEGQGVLLVALTGYAEPEHRQRAQEAGFDAHVAKPLTAEALADLFHTLGEPGPPSP